MRSFLDGYYKHILQTLELPAIQRAFVHARQNELRELVAYDQSLATEAALKDFSTASRIVGLPVLQRRGLGATIVLCNATSRRSKKVPLGWRDAGIWYHAGVHHLPLALGLVGYALRTTQVVYPTNPPPVRSHLPCSMPIRSPKNSLPVLRRLNRCFPQPRFPDSSSFSLTNPLP